MRGRANIEKKKVVAFIFNCALDEQTGKMSDILAIIDRKINVNLENLIACA